eukprot:2255422-Prymnesium_polylepis.1
MADLPRMAELRDTPSCTISVQVQATELESLLRQHSSGILPPHYMPPSVTLAAARLHDELEVLKLFHAIIGTAAATEA